MKEYPTYPSIEQLPTITALNRLDDELVAVDDEDGLRMAISKYVAEELNLSDAEAHNVTAALQKGALALSSPDIMGEQHMASEDAWRLSIFTDMMPLYQSSHTVLEYKTWLPKALDVALPADGNHGPHVDCGLIDDESICHVDSLCPQKSIIATTKYMCEKPDFDTYDYIVRNEDMRKGMMILLTELGGRGIIDKVQQHEFTNAYVENYYQIFSVSQ